MLQIENAVRTRTNFPVGNANAPTRFLGLWVIVVIVVIIAIIVTLNTVPGFLQLTYNDQCGKPGRVWIRWIKTIIGHHYCEISACGQSLLCPWHRTVAQKIKLHEEVLVDPVYSLVLPEASHVFFSSYVLRCTHKSQYVLNMSSFLPMQPRRGVWGPRVWSCLPRGIPMSPNWSCLCHKSMLSCQCMLIWSAKLVLSQKFTLEFTKGAMEDQTIAWVRGMNPVEICVTPGSPWDFLTVFFFSKVLDIKFFNYSLTIIFFFFKEPMWSLIGHPGTIC